MIKIMRKLVCVVFVGAVLCSGYGSVLCYGQDGHIAIEPVFRAGLPQQGSRAGQRLVRAGEAAPGGVRRGGIARHAHLPGGGGFGPVSERAPELIREDIALGYDMEPIRLHNMTQFAQVDFNIRFSNNFIASSGIFDQQSNICAFFTPLKTIRLLT